MDCSSYHALANNNSLTVKRAIETACYNTPFATASMHKLPSTNIDADMIHFSPEAFARIKKDQISIAKLTKGYRFPSSRLVNGPSRQPEIHCRKTIIGESRAVKTIGTLSCIAIRIPISSP